MLMALSTIVMGQNRYQKNIDKARAGDATAQVDVGYAYETGDGVAKDLGKALYYYREALAKGGLSQTNIEWAKNRIKTLTDSGYTAKSDEVLQ